MLVATTIIIPALNEEAVIGDVIRQLKLCKQLQLVGIIDIVVVDNGSTDATASVAQAAGARVVSEPRRGYGRACLAGVRASLSADIIVFMDGDGSDAPTDILHVWQPIADGIADMVMGSRTRGIREPNALTPQQIVGNAIGTMLMRLLNGTRLSDIGPLRAIRRDSLLQMQMAEMTYGWSTEMLIKAARLGLRLQEVPVAYRRRAGGHSKVAGTVLGTIRASMAILRTIATYARWHPGKQRHALFIVARTPSPGLTKTRLGKIIGFDTAATLYAAFLQDIGQRFENAAKQDGYDLFWYCEMPSETLLDSSPDAKTQEQAIAAFLPSAAKLIRQEDGPFAMRLWQGFQKIHAIGYDHIVVINSDSPQLPALRIKEAFEALTTHDIVIGPAFDGGYYLLGQRGAPHDLFTAITMSTSTVSTETEKLIVDHNLTYVRLRPAFDVDEYKDLLRLSDTLSRDKSANTALCPATQAVLATIFYEVSNEVSNSYIYNEA